jgi:hypothetical protein
MGGISRQEPVEYEGIREPLNSTVEFTTRRQKGQTDGLQGPQRWTAFHTADPPRVVRTTA